MNSSRSKKLPEHLRKRRLDLSSWLWHFVRRDEPKRTLEAIIEKKSITGSVCKPYEERVVCFSESPLFSHIQQDADLKTWEYKRLSLYGIGFNREWLFKKGTRPVIYTERANYDSLPENLKHLFIEFDLNKKIDFTWQREWRIKTDALEIDKRNSVLVFPDHNEFKDLVYDYHVDFEIEDAGEIVTYAGFEKLWNFIPLDFCENFGDNDIIAYINQDFYDDLEPITLDVL